MKIARKIFQKGMRAYALLMTMIFVGVALLLLGSVMDWSNSSARQTEKNNLFSMSTAAAEAATERVIAQMTFDFFNQQFNSNTNYYLTNSISLVPATSGWPVRFSFSNSFNSSYPTYVSVYPVNWTTNWTTLFSSNYAGLHAYVANCTVVSTATTSNQPYNVSATVQQQFQLAAIPIFQNAAFYQMNMEIDPGAAMTLTGPIFSNAGIWARGPNTYNSTVTAVGNVNTSSTDPWLTSKTDSAASTFNQSVISNANSLALPIGQTNDPTAIRALLNLPPSGVSPYSSTGQLYFVNQTDLVISNAYFGTNKGINSRISAYFQDSNNVSGLTLIPNNFTNIVTTVLTNAGVKTTNYSTNIAYTFATNATFYDYREGKTVQAVQLNVGALSSWISGAGSSDNSTLYSDTGHYIDSVYVYNNYPSSSTSLPSVRVANGATLPSQGLTVVTPDPLYVLGNYNASGSSLNNGTNVANTVPAALMGDSITALSANWNDATYTASTGINSRTAAATTINAATFEGIVPTAGANYSGGLENFIRLLENWGPSSGSITLTYNGSIVVMFPSQYATNKWPGTGTIYNPPTRKWAFDVNFMSENGLPPLTPKVTAICRQGWSVY